MKKFLLLLVISLAIGSCKKSTSCNVNSIEQLPWAVNMVAGGGSCLIYGGAKFYSYTFSGEQVFYFTNLLSSNSNCVGGIYYCSGNKLSFSEDESREFFNKRKNEMLLWSKN
ncbi:hypothetical protein [Daejeonella sp.]|uniref:hypothetical protein n=1 Tax=Daejeonella sp. TaxID=2805397 RepID=UPI0030C21DEA